MFYYLTKCVLVTALEFVVSHNLERKHHRSKNKWNYSVYLTKQI